MSLVLSLLLKASGDQAVAEVRAFRNEVRQTRDTVATLPPRTQAATRAQNVFQRALDGTRTRLRAAGSALSGYVQRLRGFGGATESSAGSVANLAAQFNDIGVMMAAGQNPLQLALQQGTQITQVIGPMGAAGAVRALGSAFVSLINPVSLITIGSIAAGAAITQWLTSAKDDAEDFSDALDGITSRLDRVRELQNMDSGDLRELYGALTDDVVAFQEDRTRLNLEALKADARALGTALAEELQSATSGWFTSDRSGVRDLLGVESSRRSARTGRSQQDGRIDSFIGDAQALANEQDLSRQLDLIAALGERIDEARDAQGQLNSLQSTYRQSLVDVEDALRQTLEVQRQQEQAQLAETAAANEAANQRRIEAEAERAKAQEVLTTLNEQNAIQQAIARSGEQSAEVADLRAGAERRAFEEMLDTLEVSEDLKDELRAAFERGQDLANVNMAAGISAAAAEAQRLADWLNVSLATATRIASFGPQGVPGEQGGGRGGDPRQMGGRAIDWQTADAQEFLKNYKPPRVSRGGGGGGGGGGASQAAREAEREREAVTDLIARYKDELAVLRETDPVQKELIRNRETLTAATEAERAQITDLIAERISESQALDAQRARWDLIKQVGSTALSDLISGAEDLDDVLKNVAASILDAVIQAQLFGDGPLGGGGSGGGGGLIGSLLGGLLGGAPAFSEGGDVKGPGTGTSDDVLSWLSNGEFVVTAEATRRNRDVLEAMNAGASIEDMIMGAAVARDATGGALTPSSGGVGSTPFLEPIGALPLQAAPPPILNMVNVNAQASGARNTESGAPVMHVTVDLRGSVGDQAVEERAFKGVQRAIEDYDRRILPVRVNEITDKPWRR
ncbi:phage tail length tape measure family protein [Thalassococcus sp. S3]|uniref:phage tail length tape measure family protein n=1 Tax=Thalassococcus sp. S3 TaxID=2017482 RepID=UPI00102C728F|nr:phage tail length tape measure family protein [Thalassococcus sp. S3]